MDISKTLPNYLQLISTPRISLLLLLVIAAWMTSPALKAMPILTTTDIVGDIDGFGGVSAIDSPPDGFLISSLFDNRSPSDPDFTDAWLFQFPESPAPINYYHDYSSGSTILSATLSIQTAGMGNNRGPWDILFNGISVGSIGSNGSDTQSTAVSTNVFDIPIFLLTGRDLITLSYQDSIADGYAINFSKLQIESVPEPAVLFLLIPGLFALLVARQRQLQYQWQPQ